MSGVDQHDQLRLQRYSIQRCVAFKKYYRQLFIAFVDMTVLNGFIIHKLIMKKEGGSVPTHAEYMRRLHVELLEITGANSANLRSNMSAEDLFSTSIPTSEHQLQNQENYYSANGQRKHRQHLCKVCSALAPPKTKGFETSYFCRRCTEYHGGYIPLCNCVRRQETGNKSTRDLIWHATWVNGTVIPAHLKKSIHFCKRKRSEAEDEQKEG
ncbi:hypothetical protein PF003_g10813 [Phytophthora fragariae]|nr:hypothetical protein PF003_g10813 [Phytophthora fragariae]